MEDEVKNWKRILTRRLLTAAIAVATIAGLGSYELLKPAKAAAAAPAAAPLDESSVSALLSLDRAMETLAARVTPAVVNITVTSKATAQPLSDDNQQDLQRFFEQFGGTPFGRQFGT